MRSDFVVCGFFFFQAEDGIRDDLVTGVQTCALPIFAEGTVGSRWVGRLRIFRYEVRRWRNGVIPDVAEAVESPQRLSDDPERGRRLLRSEERRVGKECRSRWSR